jgi:hypothetical protein
MVLWTLTCRETRKELEIHKKHDHHYKREQQRWLRDVR